MSEKKKAKGSVAAVVGLLDARERRNLSLVFLAAFVSALIEVVGVGSIMPFLAVASNPHVIHENQYLLWAYHELNFTDDRGFLIFLGLSVLVFLVVTSALKAVARYVVVRFTSSCRHTLSLRLLEAYLRQDYIFFLARSSSDLLKNINVEIQNMITGTLMNFVDLVSVTVQLTFYMIFLFAVSPITTCIMVVTIGGVYGGIYVVLRTKVKKLGAERFELNQDRTRIVNEALWGFKESKVFSVEKDHLARYKGPSERLARNESLSEVIGDLPRFLLEAVAFSTILLFVLWSIIATGSFQNAAATVGLFAYAGYRMIPAVQNLFKDITKLRYSATGSLRMIPEFELFKADLQSLEPPKERLPFQKNIVFEDLRYAYPSTEKTVIDGLSLKIEFHQSVGFVGTTGAGKSTLLDILMGLLEVQSGRILVDGLEITRSNVKNWQANIGYVPQTIFMSNSTVAENIAFGVPKELIDMDRVAAAARWAQLHDFILEQLPQGYETEVGERGIRLSGGQRQRIGIARALYRKPEVLVFDEATSALDNETEAALMEAVDSISGSLTLMMIAHRLTTLKKCDVIFVLDNGRVVDSGTYEELKTRHKSFQK